MVERIRVNFPLARIVQGDLYKAQDTDFVTKQKRVYPAGHRLAGQPKITYFFALAIKKQGEQHWSQTPWGKSIWEFGFAAWPMDPKMASPQYPQGMSAAQRPDFAWKIEDGDSVIPNKAGRINARSEGFAGCWIVSCSSVYPPKIIDTSFGPITEPNAVKRGFHVETVATVDTNESAGNPGIYINGEFVMFKAIDKEISGAVDPRSIQGFGSSAVPAGLTAVGGGAPAAAPAPFGSFPPPLNTGPTPSFPTPGAAPGGFPGPLPPQAATAPSAGYAPPAGVMAPMPGVSAPTPFPSSPGVPPSANAQAATPTYVAPAPSFLQPPPPAAPPPAAPPAHNMTAKAAGASYEQFRAQGWTDDQMKQQGYMA